MVPDWMQDRKQEVHWAGDGLSGLLAGADGAPLAEPEQDLRSQRGPWLKCGRLVLLVQRQGGYF